MYPFTNNSYQIPMTFDNNPDNNHRQTFNPNSQFQEITQTNSLLNTNEEIYDQTWLQIQDLFFKLQSITTTDETKRASSSSNELRNESMVRKKDRHTKINTAHGMRDRRMRLSIDVARKFFDLHDFLGFDKASKTVEWLLIKCNPAIKEIKRGEISQGIDESSTSEFQEKPIKKRCHFKKEKKKVKKVHLIGQESRKFARERARKRTTEKRKVCDFNGTQILGEQLHVAANNWNPCDDVCFWKENEDISYENHLVDFQIGDKAWGDNARWRD